MPNPRKYYLTGLMLAYLSAVNVKDRVRAAKRLNLEALARNAQHIPMPWDGEIL